MGRIIHLIFILMIAICLSACQKELTLEDRLYAYSQAQEEGELQAAAEHARNLLIADYSASPLTRPDLDAMMTDFAGALDQAGYIDEALTVMEVLVSDDQMRVQRQAEEEAARWKEIEKNRANQRRLHAIATVGADGSVVDTSGVVIGRVDGWDGNVLDNNGVVIGRVDAWGNVFGPVDDAGNVTDINGNVFGQFDENGNFRFTLADTIHVPGVTQQERSDDFLARADRQDYLGDLYVKSNAPDAAFNAFGKAYGLYGGVYGSDFFPGKIDLFKKQFYAARDANLDMDIFCELISRGKSFSPDERIEIAEVEYAVTDEDGVDQPQEAMIGRAVVTSFPIIDGEVFSYWTDEIPTCVVSGAFTAPAQSVERSPNFETINVFFGTSRVLTGSKNVEKFYNAKPESLSIGSIEMTVPLVRDVGSIQAPKRFAFKGAQDGVHIVLKRIDVLESDSEFQANLARQIGDNEKDQREAFIYIHGHGVKFSSAARRAAQLAVDLDMRRGGIFYSWPAGASATGYFKSQGNVDSSAAELKKFLKLVTETQGIDELHLIAHSMGNDVLSQALSSINLEGYSSENRPFSQIIWASPDVDAKDFAGLIQDFKTRHMADGMTLYASKKDKALQVSQWIWDKFPRAGQAPPLPDVAGLIETIDTSDVDRGGDVVAHTDYASAAIDDMRAVIWLSLQPGKRCDLSVQQVDDVEYWSAGQSSEACSKDVFRSAVTIARAEQFRYIPDVVEKSVFDGMEHPKPVNSGFGIQTAYSNSISIDSETGTEFVHVANPYRAGVGENLKKMKSSVDAQTWERAKTMSENLVAPDPQ